MLRRDGPAYYGRPELPSRQGSSKPMVTCGYYSPLVAFASMVSSMAVLYSVTSA